MNEAAEITDAMWEAAAATRSAIVTEWWAVDALVKAHGNTREQHDARANLSMALRPLRLMGLVGPGERYEEMAQSVRASIACARGIVTD